MLSLLKWGLVLFVIVMVMRACIDWIDPANVGADTSSGTWVTREALNSAGDMKSQIYQAPQGKAFIRWKAMNDDASIGTFNIRAYRAKGAFIKEVANTTVGSGGYRSGESHITDAYQFYIEVHSSIQWEITVEVMEK